MVNAWSLAASILDGTFDEDYPLMDKTKRSRGQDEYGKIASISFAFHELDLMETWDKLADQSCLSKSGVFKKFLKSESRKLKEGWSEEDEIRELDDYHDFENVGSGNTAHSDYYYDYNRNDPDAKNPFTESFDYLMGESVTGKTPWIYESPDGGKTVYRYERGTDPLKR